MTGRVLREWGARLAGHYAVEPLSVAQRCRDGHNGPDYAGQALFRF